jgi:hypothetical protein
VLLPDGQIRPPAPPLSTAETVLREWISFLQHQLEAKRMWLETALEKEQEKVKLLEEKIQQLQVGRVRLRESLLESVRDVEIHNQDGNYVTGEDQLKDWFEVFNTY